MPERVAISQQISEPITDEEIRKAIGSWPSNKSLGPDGYTGEFFKFCLEELLPDIGATLNNALQNGSLDSLNSSYIVLIPKGEQPTSPLDFTPISVIHSMQRLLSKILSGRFTPHLDSMVSISQTGFIPGRNIVEKFLYAQHLIAFAKIQKIQLGILKAGIHKAFDTLNWKFIVKVLSAVGFSDSWVSWIEGCVRE